MAINSGCATMHTLEDNKKMTRRRREIEEKEITTVGKERKLGEHAD